MESKKSMLEKLSEWYSKLQRIGNGGHIIGFYRENSNEIIKEVYKFPKGNFTLGPVKDNFFHWNYAPKIVAQGDGAR